MASYTGANTSTEQKEADRTHRALVDYARTTKDNLYALLDLPNPHTTTSTPTSPSPTPPTDTDIKAAWRRSALKHHPDKNRGHEALAATRLDDARRAFDVFKDPEARRAFDARLEAERAKREREGALGERRRKMMVELEMREKNRGVGTPVGTPMGAADFGAGFGSGSPRAGEKRGRGAGTPVGDGESVLKRERTDDTVRHLAAEGARRRAEMEMKLKKRRSGGGGLAEDGENARPSTPTPTGTTENHTPASGKSTFTFTPPAPGARSNSASASGTPASAGSGAAGKGGGGLYESTMRRLKEAQERKKRVEVEQQGDGNSGLDGKSAVDLEGVGQGGSEETLQQATMRKLKEVQERKRESRGEVVEGTQEQPV